MGTTEPQDRAELAVRIADDGLSELAESVVDEVQGHLEWLIRAHAAALVRNRSGESTDYEWDRVEELVTIRLAAKLIPPTDKQIKSGLRDIINEVVRHARERWVHGKTYVAPSSGPAPGWRLPASRLARRKVLSRRSSWADIGLVLGMTPQGASKRFENIPNPADRTIFTEKSPTDPYLGLV